MVEDEWPALEQDRLSTHAGSLLKQLESTVLQLEATGKNKETIWSRLIDDVDRISDFRLARLQHALPRPPFFLTAVIFGFLITMVCFGVYAPNRVLLVLVSLYTVFVGLVIYFILAYSDPFEGVPGVDTAPIESVLQKMLDDSG